jgi:hypothetical protein
MEVDGGGGGGVFATTAINNDDDAMVEVTMTPLIDGSGGDGHRPRQLRQWLMAAATMAVLVVD